MTLCQSGPFGVVRAVGTWRVVVATFATVVEAVRLCSLLNDGGRVLKSTPSQFAVVHRVQGYTLGDAWDAGSWFEAPEGGAREDGT